MIKRGWARRIAALAAVVLVCLAVLARLGLLRPSRIVRVSPVFIESNESLAPLEVAILSSDATARCLSVSERDRHVEAWRRLIGAWGYRASVLDESALSTRRTDIDVLVLPATLCLDEATRAAVREAIRLGGGVVATWATGARDEKGAWRGYEYLREITGALSFTPFTDAPPWFVTIASGTPLGVGAVGAARLQLHCAERLQAISYDPDAYWSDARFFPRDAMQPAGFQGAALHREDLSGGRVAWLGFHEDASVADADDARILRLLLRNAVDWAGHIPRIEPSPWPHPYRAAAVMSLVIDDQPENAVGVARALLSVGGRAVFVSSRAFDPNASDAGRRAMRTVSQTMLAAHADLRGLELYRNALKVRRSQRRWPAGLFGPIDPARIPAGFDHAIVPLPARTLRPQIVAAHRDVGIDWGRDLIVTLPLFREDRELSPLDLMGLDADRVVKSLASDLETVAALEGVFVFACRTQGFGRPEYGDLWPLVWNDWRDRGIWTATAEDIARWWRERDAWQVRCDRLADRRCRIRLSAARRNAARRLAVRMHAPLRSMTANVSPLYGAPMPKIFRVAGNDVLVFDGLSPARRHEYALSFEQLSSR